MIETVNTVFPSRNLKVNEDKTEHTFPQRGDMEVRQENMEKYGGTSRK